MGAENAFVFDQSIDDCAAPFAFCHTDFGSAFLARRAILRTPALFVTLPAPPTASRPHSLKATFTFTLLSLGPKP